MTQANLPHFHTRCAERGITVNPSTLRDDLRRAIKMAKRGEVIAGDYVERVPSPDTEAEIYRFRCADGIFYTVVSKTGVPMTVLTQDMYRSKRFAAKMERRKIWATNYKPRRL